MLSRKTIETYLFFLLRHKVTVAVVIALMTGFLAWTTHTRLVVQPDFQSLYPPNHPYIQLYNAYRNMFGTAFTVQIVVEVKDGTIFDDQPRCRRSIASRSSCCTHLAYRSRCCRSRTRS